jgi:hypothetical protein
MTSMCVEKEAVNLNDVLRRIIIQFYCECFDLYLKKVIIRQIKDSKEELSYHITPFDNSQNM